MFCIQGHFSTLFYRGVSRVFNKKFLVDDPVMLFHWFSASCWGERNRIGSCVICSCNGGFSTIHAFHIHMLCCNSGSTSNFIFWILCLLHTGRNFPRTGHMLRHIALCIGG